MFLVDAGLGTPGICMQDEPTGVPINRATGFENKVGFLDLVAGESPIKEQILERFFIDLVAGEALIKKRAASGFNDLVGSTDVVVVNRFFFFHEDSDKTELGWNRTRFGERIQRISGDRADVVSRNRDLMVFVERIPWASRVEGRRGLSTARCRTLEWQRKARPYLFFRALFGHTVPAEDQVGEPCDGKPSRTVREHRIRMRGLPPHHCMQGELARFYDWSDS
ncbi:hypothetical protein RND71_035129 [Anisodus tanguticus]|uniref:Uncharacterized protein n=1 Tax=Anisodus tanguticus TaxID=243964 RepID=A0AAE1R4I9_9SOLA|nr:hypothetical protein RND71_035129 [Anisodus tanguticus]